MLPSERELIIAYKRRNPDVSYRRLAYELLDRGRLAVAPSSVYRVLREAGLAATPNAEAGVEPTPSAVSSGGALDADRPHVRWHLQLIYPRLLGFPCFFVAVLDEYSRFVVYHDVRSVLRSRDLEYALQRAAASLLGEASLPPALVTNGDAPHLFVELNAYLREAGLTDERPSGRRLCIARVGVSDADEDGAREEATSAPEADLDAVRRRLAQSIERYNHQRPHGALKYLRPYDYLQGETYVQGRLRARTESLRDAAMARRRYWKADRSSR